MSTPVLTRYLTRMFVTRCLAVLLALAALLQLLDLLDAASTVLERDGGAGDLLRYIAYRLPVIVEQVVPLAVLIGSLTTLWTLAGANEVVAMRSIGMTPYQLLGALFPAAVAVGLLHLVLSDQVVPRVERGFIDWWASTTPLDEEPEAPKPLWFRLGDQVVTAKAVSPDGRRLEGVEVFRRTPDGSLTGRLSAESASYDGKAWTLANVARTEVEPSLATTRSESQPWDTALTPGNLRDLRAPTERQSVSRLRGILRGTYAGTESRAYYQTRLHETYSGPFATLVMLLLAAPVAHGLRRRGGAMGNLALGVVIGLAFLLVDGLLAAMGEAGSMPPVVAAWAPTLFFAAVGGAILVHVEG